MPDAEIELTRPQVIILDVYETLLDMSGVQRRVNDLFHTTKGYTLWFELFMQYCFVDSCTHRFHDFISIAKATMQMAGTKIGRTISDAEVDTVLEMLKHLPLHEEVREGLSQLNDMGFRLAALTNSPGKVINERMQPTGLISYFEMVLSAEQVKMYKPSLQVYEWAAQKLDVDKKNTLMVSAHEWDLAGAAGAGMQTAYLKRDRQMLYSLAPQPNLVCSSLTELAEQLSELSTTAR